MGLLHKCAWSMTIAVLVVATAIVVVRSAAMNDIGTASAKQSAVWNKITGTQGENGPWPSTLQLLKLFIESMDPTMHTYSDEMPDGRQKLIHSVGATAKFHFQWYDAASQYTGLFQSAQYGIVRVSGAKKWDTSKDAKSGAFTPGMGVKLFRTNQPSANFVAMRALTPQDSWNPFAYTWTNHVSHDNLDLGLKAIAAKFGTVSEWASHVGLSDLASYTESGQAVSNPKFPFQLLFAPTSDMQRQFPTQFSGTEMPDQLTTINSGTTLFTVYALNTPDTKEKPRSIGRMVLDSKFVKSSYADTTLFFRHQAFDEDIAKRPDWLNWCPDVYKCNTCPVDYDCFAN